MKISYTYSILFLFCFCLLFMACEYSASNQPYKSLKQELLIKNEKASKIKKLLGIKVQGDGMRYNGYYTVQEGALKNTLDGSFELIGIHKDSTKNTTTNWYAGQFSQGKKIGAFVHRINGKQSKDIFIISYSKNIERCNWSLYLNQHNDYADLLYQNRQDCGTNKREHIRYAKEYILKE